MTNDYCTREGCLQKRCDFSVALAGFARGFLYSPSGTFVPSAAIGARDDGRDAADPLALSPNVTHINLSSTW
jgi:hypothetical protein